MKKIGGMEFYDVHFSYIDKDTNNEEFVSAPEQGGKSLFQRVKVNQEGHVCTIGPGDSGMIGVFKIEVEVVSGAGKFNKSGLSSSRLARENTVANGLCIRYIYCPIRTIFKVSDFIL